MRLPSSCLWLTGKCDICSKLIISAYVLTFRGLIIQYKEIKPLQSQLKLSQAEKSWLKRKRPPKVEQVWLSREHIFCFRSHTGEDPLLCAPPNGSQTRRIYILGGRNVQANSHQDTESLGGLGPTLFRALNQPLHCVQKLNQHLTLCSEKSWQATRGKTSSLNYAPLSRQVAAFLFIFLIKGSLKPVLTDTPIWILNFVKICWKLSSHEEHSVRVPLPWC